MPSVACPSCAARLEPHEPAPGVEVSLCPGCKAMLTPARHLATMVGASGDVDWRAPFRLRRGDVRACASCGAEAAQALGLTIDGPASVLACSACDMLWLARGALASIKASAGAAIDRAVQAGSGDVAGRAAPPTLESYRSAADSPPREPPTPDAARGGVEVAEADSTDAAAIALQRQRGLRLEFDHPVLNALYVPGALAAAYLITGSPMNFVVRVLMTSWVHELGHALALWLAGFFAIPTFLVTVSFGRTPSLAFTLLVAVGLAVGLVVAVRQRFRFMLASFAIMAVAHVALAWVLSPTTVDATVSFAGCAGEIVLGAALVAAFYHPLPDRLRWDFWRLAVVLLAACSLVGSTRLWLAVDVDLSRMPMGSAYGGSQDANGDMNRLIGQHGWTARDLVRAYLGLAAAGYALIAAHYAHFLRRAWPRLRPLLEPYLTRIKGQ